ncbi:PepSY domain-containing protein [Phenylobacterium sp.]|uniref:PepSY domain-containing protein n=1 Tax=Phenylobacterium sp. TaxID=1871053 RepID=UPI00286B33BC|nr:PepSY domain-containing protein [Phenylobacterium sp.]
MKALVWFHRWVGIVLCLMFATWFATGAVMVFVAFPSLSPAARAAASQRVDLARVNLDPAQAAAAFSGASELQLVSVDGTPAYLAKGASGTFQAISAETGRALAPISARAAADIAARFAGVPADHVDGPFDYDQWIVHQQFDPLRPFFKVRLSDREHTDLYVSARTGQVAQRTLGFERGWNWFGSVVHWVYFVPIRKTFALWDWSVWAMSLVGLTTTVAGLWLGVSRTRTKLRSRRPDVSPFRGLLRWHHILGLSAGVFVLCWITSGWLSMDHGRLFSEGVPAQAVAAAYRGGTGDRPAAGFSVADLRRLGPTSSVEFLRVSGHEVAAATSPQGPRVLVKGPRGVTLHDHIPQSLVLTAARAAWPGQVSSALTAVPVDSAYAKAESLPVGALMLKLDGAHPARLYVDGVTGKILVVMDRSRETYAWVYYMLHTYNYPGLASRPALRITILLVPLTLGLGFAVTGVLVGVRRLRARLPAAAAVVAPRSTT